METENKEITLNNADQNFWNQYERRMIFRSSVRGHRTNQQKVRKQKKNRGRY